MNTRRAWPALFILLPAIAGCPSGIPQPGPYCQRTQSLMLEATDNFTPPAIATFQSAALTGMLANSTATQPFDASTHDAHFGASFRIDAFPVCRVTLEIGVRQAATGYNNDQLYVGVAPFTSTSAVFHNSFIWQPAGPQVKLLTVSFPSGPLLSYLNGNFASGTVAPVDVFIQDDTNVDFIRVTYVY